MKTMSQKIILMLILFGLSVSCTEDRVQKQLLKYEVYSKSLIDTEANYLYVPLGQESSRTSLYGRAYEVGQSKVVKIQLNEFSMDVVSIEKDDRFGDNPSNQKILLSIPVDHVDYRCADDAYGECVGEEVTNTRISWDQRNFIIPRFEQAKIYDTNFFSYEFSGPNSCYQQNKVELTQRSIDEKSLNFTLRREYKDQLMFFCTRNHDLSDFTNLNWTENTSYSLVKLDEVASPNYQAQIYHPDWVSTFGFFEVDDFKLDIDGNAAQSGELKYINRWNPERTTITYHLNEAFNKPENQTIKAATYESIKRINDGLAISGAKFKIELVEPSAEINIGDLRNSMIVLVDDPVASSVIGYGPSVDNPLTGEVISARTIMYAGSIRKFTKNAYDEIVIAQRELLLQQIQASPSDADTSDGSSTDVNTENLETTSVATGSLLTATTATKELLSSAITESHGANSLVKQVTTFTPEMVDFENLVPTVNLNSVDRTPHLTSQEMDEFINSEVRRDILMIMAGQNKYPAEAMTFGDINQDIVQEVILSVGQLQPWEQLSDQQKQAALDVLVPYVWVPVFIHEIGHNLGLRHNFSGSEDADHFYSQEELAQLNVPTSTTNTPYSSVMDYPKSEVNALRTFGKYDIAALKFAYTDSVNLVDGSELKIDAAQEKVADLPEFNYCSDDGVTPNPNCNPFDEGTTLPEIVDSIIDTYKTRFQTRNFRKGRAHFSTIDDDFYLRSIRGQFQTLRLVYERYESLVKDFQLDQETIDSVPFLAEIDEAAVKTADFFMDVIATPDTLCAINAPDGLQIVPIGIFSTLAHQNQRNCESLELAAPFVAIAEGGKPLNSFKLPSNNNRFADQIDVRGTWIDRALAMDMLFKRKLGSSIHDEVVGNYLDHPKVSEKLSEFLSDMMMNTLTNDIEFKLQNGETVPVNFAVDFDADFYEVSTPDLGLPSRILGLPYDNLHLPEMFAILLKNSLKEGSDSPTNSALKNQLQAFTTQPSSQSDDYVRLTVQGQQIFVPKESQITGQLAIAAERAKFYESTELTREELVEIANSITAAELNTEDVNASEVSMDNGSESSAVKSIKDEIALRGSEDIMAYLDNSSRAQFYERILSRLVQ